MQTNHGLSVDDVLDETPKTSKFKTPQNQKMFQ